MRPKTRDEYNAVLPTELCFTTNELLLIKERFENHDTPNADIIYQRVERAIKHLEKVIDLQIEVDGYDKKMA